MFKNCIWLLITLGTLGWIGSTQAAEAPDERDFTLTNLTVTAVPESVPILKHALLPRASDQKTGNAALFYYGAAGLMPDMDDELSDTFKQWREQPVETLPRKEVDAFLATFEKSFDHMRLASLRDHCDWEVPVEKGYGLELPSLAAFRQLIRVMALKIRLDLADKNLDTALDDIRHMLAMGRNLAAGPTLIQDLVGAAIAHTAVRELIAWPQDARAPNLYWALSALPTPFIDIRPSLEMEMDLMFREFPDLRNLERETLSVEQANALVTTILAKIGMGSEDNKTLRAVAPATWTMLQYSDAKAFLKARQWTDERIKALPVAQAVLIYQVQQYVDNRDRTICWLFLPYADAYAHQKEADQARSELYGGGVKFNVFAYFMPALYRISFIQTRLDRDIAMLRIAEALRMEAAHNQGRLPKALSDITRVPIPDDPLTGKPFIYNASDAHHARLEAPLHPEESKQRPVFELTLRP
jgi:hypothetical protein